VRTWLVVCVWEWSCTRQPRQTQDLIKMAQQGQSAIVKYVFNYNMLESVSIVISTSILLCGLVCCGSSCHPVFLSPPRGWLGVISVCYWQMFTSGAVRDGSAGFWALVVFVGGVISFAILAMFVLIGFETVRAFRFAHLYQDIRYLSSWLSVR
jgi:hypothetical protein